MRSPPANTHQVAFGILLMGIDTHVNAMGGPGKAVHREVDPSHLQAPRVVRQVQPRQALLQRCLDVLRAVAATHVGDHEGRGTKLVWPFRSASEQAMMQSRPSPSIRAMGSSSAALHTVQP